MPPAPGRLPDAQADVASSEPDPAQLSLDVNPEQAGIRLDHFLAAQMPALSRSRLQQLIRDGHVQVGSRVVRPNRLVRAGDRVSVTVPPVTPATPAAEAIPLEILYDDSDLIVVNKPAGMVVHPAPGHASGTLVNALLHHVTDLSGIGGERRPGIVHRLDRGTSGIMVVAKHDVAHVELARQFRARTVGKTYVALVWGHVEAGQRIDLAIGRDPVRRQRMSTRARRGRVAVSTITHAEALSGVSFVQVTIATGRTHQIRVHLSAIGRPIVGDAQYGGVRQRLPSSLRATGRLTRPFLHAAELRFTHPRDGRSLSFRSPLPDDLQSVLDELRKGAGRDRSPVEDGEPSP